jgi:hypothetical protein
MKQISVRRAVYDLDMVITVSIRASGGTVHRIHRNPVLEAESELKKVT